MDPDINTQRPSRSDKAEERRRQIMAGALKCFARRGYHGTTMDDIVTESGLSKGSLYWYFKSKDDLFISMSTSFFLDAFGDNENILKVHTTAADKLRAMTRAFVEFYRANEDFFNVFFEFWLQSSVNEEMNQVFRSALLQFQKAYAQVIKEGIQNGELKTENAEQLTWGVMAGLDGLTLYAMLLPDVVDLRSASEALMETLLRGLAPNDQ